MTAQENAPEEQQEATGIRRKDLLKAALIAPLPLLAVGTAVPALARDRSASNTPLAPTPQACEPGDLTHEQMEGPYFKPNSPARTSIVDGSGTPLTVSGFVFDRDCRPVANALLDFWQADVNGAYDNVTYRFRGHQYTDAQGAYRLTTIIPGLYPGRTRHIHVKAQAPSKPILTTQLYFPGEPRNNTDSLFDPALLMNIRSAGGGQEGTFDFVLNLSQGGGPTDPPGGTWAPGVSYNIGDTVTYGGGTYRCTIAHTSMVGWEPPNAPALWQAV